MPEVSLNRIRELSGALREGEEAVQSRKKAYELYEAMPYERNILFVKNFEKLPEDPASFDPLSKKGGALPKGVFFSVASIDGESIIGTLPKGVSFSDELEGGNALGPSTLPQDEDKLYYLNAALRSSSHRFAIAEGQSLSEPVTRLTVSAPGASAHFRHTEMEFGEASSSIFLDRIADSGEPDQSGSLLGDLIDVHLGANASLTFVTLSTGARERICHNTKFVLEDGAKLTYVTWYAASPYVRARTNIVLKGEGGEANLYWGGFPKVNSRYDYMAYVEHLGRSTKGFVLQRGLVKGQSRMLLKGLMTIRHSAVNADSHLSQHALLLTRDSFANAIPGLEIETNELKAKHAASVSQPDEDQLFYLMSRGLTREESIMEVAGGYLNPLSVNIPDQAAREAFEAEIGKALKG
jgi:Fe-S cluster assembly scaffold protein SufB